MHERGTRGAREGYKRCTRGVQEVHERGTRGALTGTKVELVCFILTRLGHGWDTVETVFFILTEVGDTVGTWGH